MNAHRPFSHRYSNAHTVKLASSVRVRMLHIPLRCAELAEELDQAACRDMPEVEGLPFEGLWSRT